ncbi:MAG: molybdopterin cofactor-binding domain-containing protein [Caldilineaceae bacterium]
MSESPVSDLQSPVSTPRRKWRITRRGFLIGVGVAGAGLALGVPFGLPYARLKMAEMLTNGGGPPGSLSKDPFAWFEITPDSHVRLFLTKVEMGQGVHTALAQIAAEELGIGFGDLEVVQANTNQGPTGDTGTTGSTSVATVYQPLREAAAMLQQMLRAEAARVLQQPADALKIDGRTFVVANTPDKSVAFGQLVANKQNWQVPKQTPPLKPLAEFQIIGQPLKRVDIPHKVNGEAVYGYDTKLPGMLYGAVARPPTIAATLTSAAPGEASTVAGVKQLVIDQAFAGVVATSRSAAHAAVDKLAMQWDKGKLWQQAELEQIVTVGNGDGITIQKVGDAPGVLAKGSTLTAEYRSPFAVQASLEPQAALADVQPDHVRVWVSTQMAGYVKSLVAKAVGVKEAAVEVIPTYLGGGFGRKTGFEVAVEAARLSKAAGAPVHVGWNRTEEMRYGYFRPPTHHQLHGTLDAQGRIVALEHRQASGDVAFGFLPGFLTAIMGADFGAYRGATVHYAGIPNRHTITWRHELPVRTGWWRGLGLLANTFAVESFMDELAHKVGIDPLQFRLNHLGEDADSKRMRAVLEAAAQKAGWGSALPASRARGIACCMDGGTCVAEVAEVSLDEKTHQLRVHQVTAVMDCGLTINPNGAAAQMEGNVIWGVGSTLLEEMRIKDGQVDITNFDNYPLLTLHQAPHVETVLLEAGDGKPRGVGEPPIGPVAAAIGNALFALTGKRVRQLPMTPARVAE